MLAQLLAAGPPLGIGLLPFTLAWLAAAVFWLWTLLDCLTTRRVTGRAKTVRVIVLLCA